VFGDLIQLAKEHEDDNPEDVFMQYTDSYYERLLDSGWVPAENDDDPLVEQAKIVVMALAYIDTYGVDDRREVEFSTPLVHPVTGKESPFYVLGGKIDGVLLPGGKHVVIVEDKFVKQIQRAMIARLPLDSQISEYVAAWNDKGWTAEILYRHTRYPGINPKAAKKFVTKDDYPGETIDEFKKRLQEDVYTERPEFYFDEQRLIFPVDHMEDYRTQRWFLAQDIKARTDLVTGNPGMAHGAFPMNSSRCWEYGGCEFIPLCTKQEGAIDNYVIEMDNVELGIITTEYGQETA
jgi:hypothetical protein